MDDRRADPTRQGGRRATDVLKLCCPHCQDPLSFVTSTRTNPHGEIVRKRTCNHCRKSYTTIERVLAS